MKHCEYCNDTENVPLGFYCNQVDPNSTLLEPCRNCNSNTELPHIDIKWIDKQ